MAVSHKDITSLLIEDVKSAAKPAEKSGHLKWSIITVISLVIICGITLFILYAFELWPFEDDEIDDIEYEPFVIIGGYGNEGITLNKFTSDDNLTLLNGPIDVRGDNPTTFALNRDHNLLYVASDNQVATMNIFGDFGPNIINMTLLNTLQPVEIIIDKYHTFLYIANYGGSEDFSSGFQVFKVDSNTGLLVDNTPIIEETFVSGSRVHSIRPHRINSNHFYIADLGRDTVEHYEIIEGNGSYSLALRSSIILDTGCGPRTLAFHPAIDGILYVSRENDYKVSVLSFNINTFVLENEEQTFSTLPETNEWSNFTSFVGHISTDNLGKYLYVANRVGVDNIAIFEIDTNNGLLVNNSIFLNECGGIRPRFFNIDPTNYLMFICNQFGEDDGWPGTKGNVAIYEIDHDDGGKFNLISNLNFNELGYQVLGPAWVEFISNV